MEKTKYRLKIYEPNPVNDVLTINKKHILLGAIVTRRERVDLPFVNDFVVTKINDLLAPSELSSLEMILPNLQLNNILLDCLTDSDFKPARSYNLKLS